MILTLREHYVKCYVFLIYSLNVCHNYGDDAGNNAAATMRRVLVAFGNESYEWKT